MEINGFTITPDSGSNNGKITVNATPSETSKSYALQVQGGGITKTCMITQKGITNVFLNFTTNTGDLFNMTCAITKDPSETGDLAPNYAKVAFNTVSSYDGKVVELKTFNERASHNIDTYRVLVDYYKVDASKKVGLHISIEKFPKNTYILPDCNATIWKTYRIIRISSTINTSTPREQRMTTYKKMVYEMTSTWHNYTPDSVRQLYIMDNVITKADGDILRAESVEGKVNVIVVGSQQQ